MTAKLRYRLATDAQYKKAADADRKAADDGDCHIPCDYRLDDKGTDGLTKNDHFGAMLRVAKVRSLAPDCVACDGWYSGLEYLKLIGGLGWRWLTRLKVNRRDNLDRRGNKAVGDTAIAPGGEAVHLEGYGMIRVFRIVSRDGDTEHWATDDLTRPGAAGRTWAIEDYHRGLKQCCGVERCQARAARAQRNHVGMATRAFLRLELDFYATGASWYEFKGEIIRDAVRVPGLSAVHTVMTA